MAGIIADFSDWQYGIDFDILKEKFDGVIFKIAEGKTGTDHYKEYAKACKERGIAYGVYVYSKALSVEESKAEAEAVARMLEEADMSPALGVWYDIESPEIVGENGGDGIGIECITANISKFISTLNEKKIYAGVYGPWWVIRDRIDTEALADYVPYWVSWVGAKNPLDKTNLVCAGWQNRVDGVNGVSVGKFMVDASYWFI